MHHPSLTKKDWLLMSAISLGVGLGIGLLAHRTWKDALLSSAIAVPSSCAGLWGVSQYQRSSRHLSPSDSSSYAIAATGNGQSRDRSETAIFWDYENVKISAQGIKAPLAESIVAYSESQGHLRLKTVYANWRRENEFVVQTLYSLGFEPIHVSMKKPNSVDVKLTVDCLRTAYQHPEINRFIIVTADKDFIPLVNSLKSLEKKVTVIGRVETVSEQLILSADEFIPLEELLVSKPASPVDDRKNIRQVATITYQDAVECLLEAIDQAQNQGRSTRFAAIDPLMRANTRFNYQGVASIRKPDTSTFENFTAFVSAVEKDGRVYVQVVDGFKEVFLIGEESPIDTEASAQDSGVITREQWLIIVERLQKAFAEGRPGPTYGRFKILLGYVRQAGREGQLPNNYGALRTALSQLMAVGVLVRQGDGSYRLTDEWETHREEFLNQLIQT